MILLHPSQVASLRAWFQPEAPAYPLIGPHIVQTGHGPCWVDHWPDPHAVLIATRGNYYLSGNPDALQPSDLQGHISGFVHTDEAWEPLLRAAFPGYGLWPRVLFRLEETPRFTLPDGFEVRRFGPDDTHHLWGLTPENDWIWSTWGSPSALAGSGYAWGAWQNGQLASVACTFFLGEHHEEIGIITEPQFRRLGLAAACAGALCQDAQARGHQPTWSTSPDNLASIGVAEKLGFTFTSAGHVYVINASVPQS